MDRMGAQCVFSKRRGLLIWANIGFLRETGRREMRYVLMLMALCAAFICFVCIAYGTPSVRFGAAIALQIGVIILALSLAFSDVIGEFLRGGD